MIAICSLYHSRAIMEQPPLKLSSASIGMCATLPPKRAATCPIWPAYSWAWRRCTICRACRAWPACQSWAGCSWAGWRARACFAAGAGAGPLGEADCEGVAKTSDRKGRAETPDDEAVADGEVGAGGGGVTGRRVTGIVDVNGVDGGGLLWYRPCAWRSLGKGVCNGPKVQGMWQLEAVQRWALEFYKKYQAGFSDAAISALFVCYLEWVGACE